MARLRRTPFAIRLYAAGLWLCPPWFRRHYAEQMLRDFTEARDDAAASGRRRDRWAYRAQMLIDLPRTAVTQWFRTGALVIVVAAMGGTLFLVNAMIGLGQRFVVRFPRDTADAELLGLLLLVTVSIMLIAATIVFTLWAARPALRRPSDRLIGGLRAVEKRR